MAKKTKKEGGTKKPRAAKPAAAAAPPTEPAKGADLQKMVPPGVLTSYLKAQRKTREDVREMTGKLGPKVADMVERFGTNTKALSVCKTAFNIKDDAKLADFIEQVHYLLDASGCNERAAKATAKLGLEGGHNGTDDAEVEEETGNGEDADAGNVTRFPATAAENVH